MLLHGLETKTSSVAQAGLSTLNLPCFEETRLWHCCQIQLDGMGSVASRFVAAECQLRGDVIGTATDWALLISALDR